MQLNTIKPAAGSKKRAPPRRPRHRLGPGQDRGPRPQGPEIAVPVAYHKVGFEGGQMPLQRRLPKRGFKSATLKFRGEITLTDLERLGADEVDLLTLKAAGLVGELIKVRQGHQDRRAERARWRSRASARRQAPRPRSKPPAARSA